MIKHWHRLPREVVESPALEILKTWVNVALSNLLYLTLLLVQRDWTRWSPEVTSSLNRSVIPWFHEVQQPAFLCSAVFLNWWKYFFFFLRHKLPDRLGDSSALIICPLYREAAFCLGGCARNAVAFFDSQIQQRYLNAVAGDAFQQLNTKGF